jgi:hypothetical protein
LTPDMRRAHSLVMRIRLVLHAVVHQLLTGALLTDSFVRLVCFAAVGRPELNAAEAQVFAKIERAVLGTPSATTTIPPKRL